MYDEKTIPTKERRCVLNEDIGLRNGPSKDKVLRARKLMSKFLNTGMTCLETINTKLRNELVDCLHLLTDRVNEKSVSSGHDTKRNAREATTRANVKKGGGSLKTDVLAGQRKKRVNNMKRNG